MAKKASTTPQDPAELAKVPLGGDTPPDPEDGTPDEAVAAAQAAGVSLPGVPTATPPVDFRRVVLETKTFSLRGQIVTWRRTDVVDFGGYGGYPAIEAAESAGVRLGPVEG